MAEQGAAQERKSLREQEDAAVELGAESLAETWRLMREEADKEARAFSSDTQRQFSEKERQYGVNMVEAEIEEIRVLLEKANRVFAKLDKVGEGIVSGEIDTSENLINEEEPILLTKRKKKTPPPPPGHPDREAWEDAQKTKGVVSGEIDAPAAAPEKPIKDEPENATDRYWKMVTGKIDRKTGEPVPEPKPQDASYDHAESMQALYPNEDFGTEKPAPKEVSRKKNVVPLSQEEATSMRKKIRVAEDDVAARLKDAPVIAGAKARRKESKKAPEKPASPKPQDIINEAAGEALRDIEEKENVREVEFIPEEMTYQELTETLPVQMDVLLEGDYVLDDLKSGQELIDAMHSVGILTDEFHDELSSDHIRRNVLFRNFVKEREQRRPKQTKKAA